MISKNFPLAPEGWPILAIAFLLTLIGWYCHVILGIIFFLFLLFSIYFFRNPRRVSPLGAGLLTAPADGKVIEISKVDESRFLKSPVHKISIFMSPFNVHVNRVPDAGVIQQVHYNKGKFFPAFEDKASLANEQNAVVIKNTRGELILFVQIAGWLARRIVCHAQIGGTYKRGEIFGLIRFGSRMDVYFPLHYKVTVEEGQIVRAGESILAQA